mgnify:CR=1 FL=1
MKKRILSILLTLCMVLCLVPTAAFAEADSDTMPKTLSGAFRPAATQYTYTLHYDANGGSGAPPSQSVKSTEFYVWVPISEKIPTRDGYTFMGWANTRTGKPIYGGNGGYTECLVVHGSDMSTTIYAIWEVHNHSWGEWISNGNGTHKRTCNTDSSHTETGSCSGGKATGTEKAICETCHTAYGELLQLTKTVITTPPALPAEGYVGNEYIDEALQGGEAKAEGTGDVVPGSFRFKHNGGGRVVRPGENRMEVLFTPNDTEAYTTAECIVTVTGIKRTITRVPEDVVITDKPLGTPFADLGLPLSPYGVMVETNTGASFSPIPVTWDGSTYNPNIYGEQIITGELHVEQSRYTDKLEPTSTVKATARITLIDDRVFTPTLEQPTYSKQLYGGDLCFLVFSDKHLSGGTATANGKTVSGKFTLDKDQKIYGHSLTASTLLQAGQLRLKVIFTPDNPKRYTKAECTVDVNVIPRKYMHSSASYITNKKFGTSFENLDLSDSFSFYAVGDENDPNGTGSNYDMPVVTSWDASTYDPNSFEEQTIYGEVNRAELEKYFTIPDSADLRAVRKVRLEPDPVETEITQLPVFQWKNGDFTLPDNTIFTCRKLQVGTYNAEVGTLVGGVVKVKGTDTVAPGTFSFKKAPPFYLQTPGEHDVTVVFTPDDLRLHKPTETTIKINAIKNTIKDIDEPDPITDKSIGTPFAELGLPENVCINGVDGAWRWIEAAWNESSYNAQSPDWQTITGTLVLDEDANSIFQQPEPAVTASIQVKLTVPDSPPTVTTETLPGGTIDTPYSQRLFANGTEPIAWEVSDGKLPEGLNLNETTGVISGTPTAAGTATFIVKAKNHNGLDTKTLSITIAEAAEFIVTFDENGGTPSVGSMTTTDQKLPSLPSASRSGSYSFDGWYTEKSGGIKVTLNQVYTANTTLYAYWIYTGGSSSSKGRDDPSGNAFITDRPNKDNPTTPTTAKSNPVKVDSKGNAVITRSIVADVISVAQSDSIKHGNTKNGIAVVVPVEISKALAGVQITLKADALDKLVSSGVKRFTIDTDSMADFGFMLDTLKELNRQTTGDLILKMKKTAVTSQEAETAIGNRPVYDITLWEVKNGKETAVNLSGKTVSIAIPYTPAKNEQPDNLYAVYVDENGNVQWISKSSYNMDQEAVIFAAEHFSIYGIGYKNQIPAFTDVNNHWAKDNMLFVVSRGLLSGTSATTFSPNTGMTRGMFVTALGRLAGVDPTDYQASRFTDVKEDAYYAPYVNWAAKTGVVSGTTDTAFAPDININREQMAVIMKNYAAKLGYTIPKTLEVVNFADSAGISSWAKEAVKSMQQAGILAGKTNNCFDPAGTATRAEVAAVLRRFVEIVIDPQTANG